MTRKQDARIDLAYCNGFKAGNNNAMLSMRDKEIYRNRAKEVERAIDLIGSRALKELLQKSTLVSNCCGVAVIENTDLCSQCKDHCGTETEGAHYD